MTKFKTFKPWVERTWQTHLHNATDDLNDWLKENPIVEIINWRTTAVGTDLCITIEYREKEHTTSVCSGGCP